MQAISIQLQQAQVPGQNESFEQYAAELSYTLSFALDIIESYRIYYF